MRCAHSRWSLDLSLAVPEWRYVLLLRCWCHGLPRCCVKGAVQARHAFPWPFWYLTCGMPACQNNELGVLLQ